MTIGLAALRRAALLLAAILAIPVIADAALPPPIARAGLPAALVLDREGRWLHAFAAEGGRWRFAADLDDIDPAFIERLIAVEDQRFWTHAGVDPAALIRAAGEALRAGRIVSGGSTITMQTARLLEPRARNPASKAIEIFRAVQIESRLSKREILELYLTLAPYGGSIEGVRAASLAYFGHEPNRLSDAEQALLIALPQAPEARRPDRRPAAAAAARQRILTRLAGLGLMTPARAVEAGEAGVPQVRRAFPRMAYHAAWSLADAARRAAYGELETTLDERLQRSVETIARMHARQASDGATVALLVVDNRTMGVRAAVGAADLNAPGGWIDMTRAVRSPGSTLKPLIYGLAFDDGIAGPDTVIDDMPTSFDGYAPENFDRAFHGEVRAADALRHSLNVPAVTMLNRLGAPRLEGLLNAAGLHVTTPRRARSGAGLTLALGGAGVTMRDLAALYAGLANDGVVRPLAWTVAEEARAAAAPRAQMITATSAQRIAEILREAPALAGRSPAALARTAPRIAFKTGTSYGYRDAWAAGFAGAYTAIVWVGRADGAPRPGETGRAAAAPILFDVFDAIARFDPAAPLGPVEADPAADGAPDKMEIARLLAPRRKSPPEIVFPRDGVEVFAQAGDARGLALAARGGAGGYRWYVGGEEIRADDAGGRAMWKPSVSGFYDVVVVDAEGRAARAKVRVALSG